MLNSFIITIQTASDVREVFVSPLMLQSKKIPAFRSGTITIATLCFYANLEDKVYKAKLKREQIADKFKTSKYIINYAQYYIGSLNVDFAAKRSWNWQRSVNGFSEQDVQLIAESLFNPDSSKVRNVVMFTPTKPSNFNFGISPGGEE